MPNLPAHCASRKNWKPGVIPLVNFVTVGEVMRARGVKGELLVRPETESMERFLSIRSVWVTRRNFEVERSKSQGELALVKLKGIDSREDAMEFAGLALEIPRSEVPSRLNGEHYMFELVGMKVTRTDGIELGTVTDILETGSNIVYVVRSPRGKEVLIPATQDAIEKLDYENCEIRVRPVPGLFDD